VSGDPAAGDRGLARFLFLVVDAYFIRNRGLLVFPDALPAVGIRRGDSLHLRRPDGSEIITTVSGVEALMDATRNPVGVL
jgi:hypothetical protein